MRHTELLIDMNRKDLHHNTVVKHSIVKHKEKAGATAHLANPLPAVPAPWVLVPAGAPDSVPVAPLPV